MPSIGEHYEKGWQAIVKPLRIEYSANDLGPAKFNVGGSMVIRTDFTLTNKRGFKLACSFFEHSTIDTPIPCVVYCHANGSCRLEALQYKQMILSAKFHYFCFDFTACGSSEGEYGSIGHFEQEDLDAVLKHVQSTGRVSKIALWGRSMGAVTSIMYCAKNPLVSCIVLDSPYATFKRLVRELAKNRASVPQFLTNVVLGMLRKTVKKKAKFDVYDLVPIEYVGRLEIPALFGAPKDDTFVSPQHTKDLYMTHNGRKQLGVFEGDHNSQRPLDWIQRVVEFLKTELKEEEKNYGYIPQQQNMQSQVMQANERYNNYNQGSNYGYSQQQHQQDHYGQSQVNGYGQNPNNYGQNQGQYNDPHPYGQSQVNTYGYNAQNNYQRDNYQSNNYQYSQESNHGYQHTQSYGYNSGQAFVPINTESRLVRPTEPGYPGRI